MPADLLNGIPLGTTSTRPTRRCLLSGDRLSCTTCNVFCCRVVVLGASTVCSPTFKGICTYFTTLPADGASLYSVSCDAVYPVLNSPCSRTRTPLHMEDRANFFLIPRISLFTLTHILRSSAAGARLANVSQYRQGLHSETELGRRQAPSATHAGAVEPFACCQRRGLYVATDVRTIVATN